MVLALAGPEPGELAPPELEMLSRSLMGTLLRLARERDVGAQVGGGRGIQGQVEEWEGLQGPSCVGKMGMEEAQMWSWGWASVAASARFSLWWLGADVRGTGWVPSDP